MAGPGSLVLRPWIRRLILGSEALSSPRAVQLLEVLEEAEAPGPSRAPDTSDVGTTLLVSDGTHSVRCLVTRETLNASDWEEKEFGFRGAEGRLLLLQDCEVRVQVAERGAPAEFFLQVDGFSLLPTEQPRERVIGCNQDPDVQKKLHECLEEHLSESTSSNTGLSLSQLLDEVEEDQEHWGALVHLAESCLMLAGPCTASPLTRWAASCHRAMGEVVYTVPSLWLHISENDQRILSSLHPGQKTQGLELPPPDPALQELSLTLISSSSSPSSSGSPALPSHMSSEENSTSVSLLPALSLAAVDPVQQGSSQPLPAVCLTPGPLPSSSPHPSCVHNSPLLSCTPSLSPLDPGPSPHQAHVTRAQKPSLEFKELGLHPKNWQRSRRTRTIKGALESSPVWDPPKRHRDGSAFQYEYEPPCTSLCAQVQAARLPPQLVAWALYFLMEPQPESELTQPHLPRLGDGGASSFGLRFSTGERCSRRGRSEGHRKTWSGLLRSCCLSLCPPPNNLQHVHMCTHACLMSFPCPCILPCLTDVVLLDVEKGLVRPLLLAFWPPDFATPHTTGVSLQGPEPYREACSPPSPISSFTQAHVEVFPLTNRGLELVLMHRHCSSPC